MWRHDHTLEANLKSSVFRFVTCVQRLNFSLNAWRHIAHELVMSHVQSPCQRGNLNLPNIGIIQYSQISTSVPSLEDAEDPGLLYWVKSTSPTILITSLHTILTQCTGHRLQQRLIILLQNKKWMHIYDIPTAYPWGRLLDIQQEPVQYQLSLSPESRNRGRLTSVHSVGLRGSPLPL